MFSLQSSPPPSGAAGETLRADAAAPSHLYGARCLHALSTLPQPAGVQDPAAATAPSQRQTSVSAPLLIFPSLAAWRNCTLSIASMAGRVAYEHMTLSCRCCSIFLFLQQQSDATPLLKPHICTQDPFQTPHQSLSQ
eukprot:XP_020398794.1 uncharacterized protein LOC109941936 [Zea mays]